MDQFALVLRQELKRQDYAHAHNALRYTLANAQYFNRSDYVDLIDFIQKVEERLGLDAFKETFELYEKLDFAQACPNWIKLLKWYWVAPSPTQPIPQG